MAQITIYHDADVTVNIVDGAPPADQSALVAQLQSDLSAMTAEMDQLQTKIDNAKASAQADKDADAANAAGQGVLDALA
jgi:outer membrane murein-binding lipoprotein Lpp